MCGFWWYHWSQCICKKLMPNSVECILTLLTTRTIFIQVMSPWRGLYTWKQDYLQLQLTLSVLHSPSWNSSKKDKVSCHECQSSQYAWHCTIHWLNQYAQDLPTIIDLVCGIDLVCAQSNKATCMGLAQSHLNADFNCCLDEFLPSPVFVTCATVILNTDLNFHGDDGGW